MIWGFTLHPGEPCTKTVDKEVHLTMAALDGDTGVNDVNKKKCCKVLMVTESSELLLMCTLVEGLIYQQNVDLQLMPGERVTFYAHGGRVHLTGYSHVSQNVNVNKNSESSTEAPDARTCPESLMEQQAGRESDVIEELFCEQSFAASGSKAHKVPVQPKKGVPQKKVETKISNSNINPGEHGCNEIELYCAPSSGSKAHKVPVQPKKDEPQKKVETKKSKTNISPGEHGCIKRKKNAPQKKVETKTRKTTNTKGKESYNQPKKDVSQKRVRTKVDKTTTSVEEESCIVIKEESMDLSIVASEPEVTSSRVEATPKQSTDSINLGDSQESAPSNKDKDNASHLTSRSNSPVECINQALSITYIPSELEDRMVSKSVKDSDVSEIKLLENGNREVENRHLNQEIGMAPAQTSKAHNIATVTHTKGPGNQLRNSLSILRGNGQEVQGISQLNEKRDVLLHEAVERSDIVKTAEDYHYVCPEIQLTGSDKPYRDGEKCHEQGQMHWAQTKAYNASQVMQTTEPESQRRTLPFVDGSQLSQEIDQRNQEKEAVLAKPAERPDVSKETECYQYEVRKIISAVQQEFFGQKVSMMSLLGEENKSSGEERQEEETTTPSSAVAASSSSKRKRPLPSEGKEGKQNLLKTLLIPADNIQRKRSRLSNNEKQGEAALASPSSSTAGAGVLNNNVQSQPLLENIKTGGLVIQSQRNLPQVPVGTAVPTAPGTTKSNSGPKNKCDCCRKPSEERHKIMLGENGHWFCRHCYTTFSSDMGLLKYCRIVPQGKHK